MNDATIQPAEVVNVATHLTRMAREQPYKRAVVYPAGRDRHNRVTYAHLTFRQLEQEVDRLAHGLKKAGITRQTRTVLMVRPSIEFFALIFAIFKTGAVPVVVDPGMGIQRMVGCFKESRPTAFIGISIAHVIRTLYPKYFQSVKTWITVGKRWFWGGLTLEQIRPTTWTSYSAVKTKRDETAAILFTTGSTGPAKGAVYTHGNFDALANVYLCKKLMEHIGVNPDRLRIEFMSAGEGILLAEVINEFTDTVKQLGPLGKSEGIDEDALKLKLDAVNRLIPYVRLVERERLRVPSKSEEAYNEFFTSDEVNRLFDELIGDKLAISQITSLLRERPLSTGEIADSLGLSPSDVARHMNSSSRQGLVRYDESRKCYALA